MTSMTDQEYRQVQSAANNLFDFLRSGEKASQFDMGTDIAAILRILAMLAALPSAMWPNAADPDERFESQKMLLHSMLDAREIKVCESTDSIFPDVAHTTARARALWPTIYTSLRLHTPAATIMAMLFILVEAAYVQDDPPKSASWIVAEHARQYEQVKDPSFEWPQEMMFSVAGNA